MENSFPLFSAFLAFVSAFFRFFGTNFPLFRPDEVATLVGGEGVTALFRHIVFSFALLSLSSVC
jgi:hypothetical protein